MYLELQNYDRPETIEECLRLLHRPGERVALLAGGTELNVRGHEALERVVDLQALPLAGVREGRDCIVVGAGTTLRALQEDELLASFTALREAALAFANLALQNRSTVGGRVAVDRSDQDLPPALAASGARLRLCRLERGGVVESLIDYPTTRGEREQLQGALIKEIELPRSVGRSALRRLGRTAVDAPLACCAAAWLGDEPRLVANLQGPRAGDLRRLRRSEELVRSWDGKPPPDWRNRVRRQLSEELEAYGDAWATGPYRRDLSTTLALRALAAVLGEEEVA